MDTAALGNGGTDGTTHRFQLKVGCVKFSEQKRNRDEQRARIVGAARALSAKIVCFSFNFQLCDFCGV